MSPATLLSRFGLLLAELLVLFVVVAAAIAVAGRRLGVARLRRLLGGGRITAALKGVALGFATPFCTYSAIPVFVAMTDASVRVSARAGFLLAAPILDPLIAAAIALVLSPGAAVAYTVAVFAGVMAAAVAADAAELGRYVRRAAPAPAGRAATARGGADAAHEGPSGARPDAAGGCAPASCDTADDGRPEGGPIDPFGDTTPWRGWSQELRGAVGYALALTRGMLPALVVAVAVAAAITGLVPRRLLVAVAGPANPLAVPVAALLGAPFYVSGEALVPIAAALLDQGMAAGGVFALIIAGAGVNIPEFGVLSRLLDRRLLAGLVATVVGVAVLAGYLVPALASLSGTSL